VITEIVCVKTSATIASIVEKAVDDVEKKYKEPQQSKNGIRVHDIPGKL
jgi:hypothetical protein